MRTRVTPTLALSAAQLKASDERDQALRESRAPVASSSVTPVRCGTCGEWNARTNWVCRVCGISITKGEQ